MAQTQALLDAVFTTLVVLILVLAVFYTALLTRRPLLLHLKEIYFINSRRFKEAWYLIVAALTFFALAQALRAAQSLGVLSGSGTYRIFDISFALLVVLAFSVLLRVFHRYVPSLGADDEAVEEAVRRHLRHNIAALDALDEVRIDVEVGSDIHSGRPTLGPAVSLSHYRGIVLGITQYLEQRFGELGDTLLFAVGTQTGRNSAAAMVEEGLERDAVVDEFLTTLRSAQVGVPVLMSSSGRSALVRLDECATCAGIEPTGHSECHYLNGLMAGLFEVVFEAPVEAREVQCNARGDAHCVFQVERV